MSVVINTNSAASMAANNLAVSSASLQRSLNRLSSGSKIASPSDDAGGLAVSMKLSATAAQQTAIAGNIGNTTSFLQTQDGVLAAVGKILDRMSQLKTLYQDPTKNSSDLANYNDEFVQLQNEITSLNTEKFNGISLFGTSGLNVGVTADSSSQKINVGTASLLGSGGFPTFNDPLNDLSNWTVTGGTPSASGGVMTLNSFDRVDTNASYAGPLQINLTADFTASLNDLKISFGGTQVFWQFQTGVHTIKINVDGTGNASAYMDGASSPTETHTGIPTGGQKITLFGGGGAGGEQISNFSIASTSGGGNVDSVATATSLGSVSLSTITSAIQDVATFRATNGADQSRLGFATDVLTTNKANLEAANSRITDVDVADESTQLARFNILVQSGTAMLSQANQASQVALKLLG